MFIYHLVLWYVKCSIWSLTTLTLPSCNFLLELLPFNCSYWGPLYAFANIIFSTEEDQQNSEDLRNTYQYHIYFEHILRLRIHNHSTNLSKRNTWPYMYSSPYNLWMVMCCNLFQTLLIVVFFFFNEREKVHYISLQEFSTLSKHFLEHFLSLLHLSVQFLYFLEHLVDSFSSEWERERERENAHYS